MARLTWVISDALFIDCSQLIQASSDAQLIGALASQTGYRPVFTFFNSISTLIDLASVGLIGQKGMCFLANVFPH
jgi:hypothetical protein